jgi:hypothetical protein
MVADLLEVTVKGCTLLLPVDGVSSGINIDDQAALVPASKQGIGRSGEALFESFQALLIHEDVVLKATERGLPSSALMVFP